MSEKSKNPEPKIRPEYKRKAYFLIVASIVLFVIGFAPLPIEISLGGQRCLGILGFVTILWVTETFPLALTALAGVVLLPLFGVLKPTESFVGFGSTALLFLVGALSLGIALMKTNLHKRIALIFLERFGKSTNTLIFGACIIGTFTSLLMPEHAVAAMMLPLMMSIVTASGVSSRHNFGIALFLALTYSTSVGSIGSLLGGARNIFALGILQETTGISLTFLDWMVAGVPIAVALMCLTFLILKLLYPWKEIDMDKTKQQINKEVSKLGPIGNAEKKAALIFSVCFVSWIIAGPTVGLGTIAVGGLVLLVATRTITWRDVETEMPWGLVFLFGGAVTLGHAVTSTGAVNIFADYLVGSAGGNPLLILFVLLVLVVFLSQIMSNSAATAVVLPIALSIIFVELSLSPKLPAYLIAMGSAMAFMLPIATPSAAIAYSSGYIEMRDLLKAGFLLSCSSIAIFMTFGLGWWKVLGIW